MKVTNHIARVDVMLLDTLWVQLVKLVSMAWSMASESMILGVPDLAWLLKFLLPEQNFCNYFFDYFQLYIVLLSITPSLSTQKKMFLIVFMTLGLKSNLWSISFWIWLLCTFICAAFKSHTRWDNAHVNAPSTTILPTTVVYDLNCFSHMIYMMPTNIYQILQNFWLTLVSKILFCCNICMCIHTYAYMHIRIYVFMPHMKWHEID